MLVKASNAACQAWLGQGESGGADWQRGGDGLLRSSFDGWNDSFSAARHTCTHVEAGMVFVKRTASLGAIKDIDMVALFLLDLGGG